jgi:polyhydroxyalkanoate synthesis regulator phasin
VISKQFDSRLALSESKWSLSDNMINSGEIRCATRKGAVSDVVYELGKESADGDEGVQNEIEGHKSRTKRVNRD